MKHGTQQAEHPTLDQLHLKILIINAVNHDYEYPTGAQPHYQEHSFDSASNGRNYAQHHAR
ncbi:anthranilate phosphoribosyltransferase domain protein [Acinetobacter sp. 1564232]|nr:anthranilate phosphoribosyltransferase domain protein [Acinetobacter sp. 1245249]EYT26880.1 anthranilate phosphoribosyltransferase domain protein [Acinetobacter sp. 1564232]